MISAGLAAVESDQVKASNRGRVAVAVHSQDASALAATLARERERALLFRTLATLRTDIPLFEDVEQLRWHGPTPVFAALAARLDAARTGTKTSTASRSGGAPVLKSRARR